MKSKTIPEGALVFSFLGYSVAGFCLIYAPPWGVAFAVAVALTGAGVRVWGGSVPLTWIESWAKIVPLGWVGGWAFVVVMAGTGSPLVAGAFAGVVAWFVYWVVARRVAFALNARGFGALPVTGVFAVTGAVTWFVYGAVAERVALAVTVREFGVMAVAVAWAWAWAWTWFVCEAFGGVLAGSVAWAFAGAILAAFVGVLDWAWAFAGAFVGVVSGATSEAANELLNSFNKCHTFLILAGTSLSGLGFGQLLSRLLL